MNKTISRYLTKNILYPQLVASPPQEKIGIIIVIPCYNEPDITGSILAIANCSPPNCHVEVIVSINAGLSESLEIKNRNSQSEKEIEALKSELPEWLTVHAIIHQELPNKKAGVGLGRKIGMDEAIRRFMKWQNERGIIVCFDADSACDANYLGEIESHFESTAIESASINYEHPLEGDEFTSDIYNSIAQYELHLRYFIRMQKRIKLPFAFHTVGSSMACTVLGYCSVGGMNQRKAGEDFYFIHKLVKFGKHSELNSTKVIPSPRISDRVPFGTGRAIGLMQDKDEALYATYDPQSFIDLYEMVVQLPQIFENREFRNTLPAVLHQFLASINAKSELQRILSNTSDYNSFYKMFWHWFDAFLLMKYLHFARDTQYPDIPILIAVNKVEVKQFDTAKEALIYIRDNDLLS